MASATLFFKSNDNNDNDTDDDNGNDNHDDDVNDGDDDYDTGKENDNHGNDDDDGDDNNESLEVLQTTWMSTVYWTAWWGIQQRKHHSSTFMAFCLRRTNNEETSYISTSHKTV